MGELVNEQVGVHTATEVPVTTPLGVAGTVERLVRGQTEVGSQEHLPIDRLGVHVLGQLVVTPLANVAIAVIAGCTLHDFTDLAVDDQVVGGLPAWVGCGLNAHGHHAAGLLHRFSHFTGFIDGVSHWLFAIDIFAGFHGIDGLLGVPVVRGGDQGDIDVLTIKDSAIIFGHGVLVVDVEANLLCRRIEAATDFVVTVPNVGDADSFHVPTGFFDPAQDTNMFLSTAARADDRHIHFIVSAFNRTNRRVSDGGSGQGCGTCGADEAATADFRHIWRRQGELPC